MELTGRVALLTGGKRIGAVVATELARRGEIEIAKAVVAFVESDFMTGETVRVDGGRHLK